MQENSWELQGTGECGNGWNEFDVLTFLSDLSAILVSNLKVKSFESIFSKINLTRFQRFDKLT